MTVTPVKVWADDGSGSVKYYIDGIEIIGAAGMVPLAQLSDYARGSIIVGGVAVWEDLVIGATSAHLESDGTDITWQANLTMADDAWIGFSGAGRLVFDSTPAPDQVEVTSADLNFVTAAHGIIHTDGVAAGMVLRANGTRYVPSAAASTIPIAPVAQGDIIIADATPEWSILTRGAAAGYALVTTATTAVWDQTPAWTGLHSFAAGVTLNGASGANNVTVPDNVALAVELLDAGGVEYLRIVSTNAQPVINFNSAAADIDFFVEASGVADALQVRGSDGQITLGALGTGYVRSDAGILSIGPIADEIPFTPTAQGDMIVADAALAWSRLAFAGAAGYALISTATTNVWDQTPTWTGLHTFNAGITFAGASGANDVTIPDNVAIAVELLDGGGTEYLRIVSTNAQPIILFNEAGADIDFHVEASGVADALQVQGADGQITLGALGAGIVQSSAGGVLSVTDPVGSLPIAPVAQGDLIIADATPEWSILTRGAAAGYALVSTATTAVWDQTPTWTGLHTFGAGVTFSGASGANDITVPDNAAIAVELRDAGGLEYLRLVTTDAQPLIEFNNSGANINFRVEAVGVADALKVRGSDGRITLGALGAGFVQSSAGGVLSSAAIIAGDLPAHTHSGAGQGGSLAVGTTDTDATVGSVFFAGTAGVIQQDNARLFWDDTNNELAIGMALPGATLHVDQYSASGAKPVLFLDQGDVSEQCIQFSSDAADQDINLWTINVTGAPALTWDESEDSLEYSVTTAATAAEKVLFALEHESNGIVAAYFGLTQMLRMENAAGTLIDAAEITSVFTTATAGAENCLLRLTPFHSGSAVAYLALWASNGIAGGAVSVIPGGAYDVTKILRYSGCVAEETGAGTNDPTGSITPGNSDVLYTDGVDTLTLVVGALGATTISRTAGADTFTVFLSMQWI